MKNHEGVEVLTITGVTGSFISLLGCEVPVESVKWYIEDSSTE